MSVSKEESEGLTRRELCRRGATVGAGAFGTVTVGSKTVPRYSPIGRAAAHPGLLVVGGAVAVGAAYYAYQNAGDDIEDEYLAAEAFENHLDIYNDAREINEVTDETLLASIRRDARNLGNAAREDAIIESYHTIVDGGSREDADQAMQEAIDARFAEPEKAVGTRINSILEGTVATAQDMQIIESRDNDGVTSSEWYDYQWQIGTQTFLDGSQFDIKHQATGDSWDLWMDPFELDHDRAERDATFSELIITEPDPNDYEGVDGDDYDLDHVDGPQLLIDDREYMDVLDEIYAEHQATLDEVESLLQTHYDGVEAGDLSLADMLGTGAMLDTVSDAESWQEAALFFRTLGLPEAVEPGRYSFDAAEMDDFDTDRAEFDGKLAWSLPEEVEDNELPVGTTIDAEQYPGSIYAAIEWENDDGETEADVLELTGEFVIEGINSGSDYLQFESREMATADTDPDEARRIFVENRESEEIARERTIEVVLDEGGGAGGGFMDGSSSYLIVALIAILAAVGLSGD